MPDAIECEHLPTQVGYDDELQSGRDPDEDDEHADEKLATSVALCCVIKLHILEWPFIVASLRHTCAIIMLSNQHLDMPHL